MFAERSSFGPQHTRHSDEATGELPGEQDETGCTKGRGDEDSNRNFQTQVWQLQALEAAQLFL